jgi:hypothetical protein
MKPWTDNIDPTTIPDDVLKSERARRNSALRTTHSGGTNGGRPVCKCGECPACRKRIRKALEKHVGEIMRGRRARPVSPAARD